MKAKKATALCLALLMILGLAGAARPVKVQAAPDYSQVRVKLSNANDGTLNLSISGSYLLEQTGAAVTQNLLVTYTGPNMLRVTDKSTGNQIYAGSSFTLIRNTAQSNSMLGMYASGGNRSYLGDFKFTANSDGTFTVINTVPMEQYLYGVVAYEMNNSWPLEALKAQSVAARSYVVSKIASRASNSYDVVDTATDQVYRGYNSAHGNVITAVNETQGQVLTVNGSPIIAYYTASNGGQTELAGNAWTKNVSYCTMKDDPYDLANPESPTQKVFFPSSVAASGLDKKVETFLKEQVARQLIPMGYTGYSDQIEILGVTSLEAYGSKYAAPSRSYTSARGTVQVRAVRGSSGSGGSGGSSGVKPAQPIFTMLTDASGNPIYTANGPLFMDSYGNIVEYTDYVAIMDAYRLALEQWENGSGGSLGNSGLGMNGQIDTLSVNIDFDMALLKTGYSLFDDNPKKIMYYTEQTSGGFNIVNARYGHGVGMSQRGAQQMAKQGMDYRTILNFYYTGVSLTTLNYSVAGGGLPSSGGGSTGGDQLVAESSGVTGTLLTAAKLYTDASASDALATLSSGSTLFVLSQSGSLVQVCTDDAMLGYVKASSIDLSDGSGSTYGTLRQAATLLTGPGSGSGVSSLSSGASVAILSREGDYYLVASGSTAGYVPVSDVSVSVGEVVIELDPSKHFAVANSSTTLYTSSSLKKSAGTIPAGRVMEIRSQNSAAGAYNVTYNGQQGSVKKSDVSRLQAGSLYPNASSLVMASGTVDTGSGLVDEGGEDEDPVVTPSAGSSGGSVSGSASAKGVVSSSSGSLNLRLDASTTSSVVGSIAKGTEVEIYGMKENFYLVKTPSGSIGYASKDYIRVTSVAATGTAKTNVNLRQGASTSSSKLRTLSKGEQVTITNTNGDFYKVITSDSLTGYVSKKYLTVTNAEIPSISGSQGSSSADSSSGSTSSGGSSSGSYEIVATGKVTASNVNVREGKSTDTERIATLSKGDAVQIYRSSGDYYRIVIDGKLGYVLKKYVGGVTLTSGGSSSESSSGSSSSASVQTGTVTASSLNVRSESGTKLYKLQKGDKVSVLGVSGTRYKIKYDGKVGYAESKYIKVSGGSSSAAATGTVTASTLNVRESASTSADLVGTIPKGTVVTLLATSGDWYKISYNDITGYALAKYIKR